MKLVVTGASGFIGGALVRRSRAENIEVVPVIRAPASRAGERSVGDIDGDTDWSDIVRGADAVVHLAARVHEMGESSADARDAYRRTNVAGTINLARQAEAAGVRRFVFLSSIKVNGETTSPGRPFRPDDPPNPSDSYALSKWEAEEGLRALARMEIVVIRPPLVYGPGARGNLEALLAWLRRGRPLPLGAVTGNRRSLIGVDNLVDLILACLVHEAAPGRLFLASDGEDVSTRRLIELLAPAAGRAPRLFAVPPGLLALAARIAGRGAAADRLLGNLQVDASATFRLLDWTPPVSVEDGLAAIATPGGRSETV